MLKIKILPNNQYKVYSDLHKRVKHTKSGAIHSEYVFILKPNLSDFEEVD